MSDLIPIFVGVVTQILINTRDMEFSITLSIIEITRAAAMKGSLLRAL